MPTIPGPQQFDSLSRWSGSYCTSTVGRRVCGSITGALTVDLVRCPTKSVGNSFNHCQGLTSTSGLFWTALTGFRQRRLYFRYCSSDGVGRVWKGKSKLENASDLNRYNPQTQLEETRQRSPCLSWGTARLSVSPHRRNILTSHLEAAIYNSRPNNSSVDIENLRARQ